MAYMEETLRDWMLAAGVGGVGLIERASVAEPGDVLRMLASAPPDH